MRKVLLALAFLIGSVVFLQSAEEVKEVARNWIVGPVSVSTTTVPAVYVGSANYSGRYKIEILNTSNVYDISIGTHSELTYANGFIVTNSSDAATSRIQFPLSQGSTVYALGESNTVAATVNVRVIEYK